MTPDIQYGDSLLSDALPASMRWLAVTSLAVRNKIGTLLRAIGADVHIAPTMDATALAAWEAALPPADAVLGVGGGVCMDAAKYLAWRRSLPLWLAPSATSVDACLTETIAVRQQGRVRYIGEIYPQAVLVDYGLIRTAPTHLNRAGAGDILSIHTALWDWDLAARETGEPYDVQIAKQSSQLLIRLHEAADEIRAVTDAGIRTLVELFAAEVALCRQAGSSRPEEGSEHFWAYNVEHLTRRNFIHGELVTLGVLLMAALQDNQPESPRAIAERLCIRWRPEQVGLTHGELVRTLTTAHDYVASDALPFSVLNQRPISPDHARRIVRQVCGDL